MGTSDEMRDRIRETRRKADQLAHDAERSTDPEERKRLAEKARRLRSRCEQESGMSSGDIYPLE
ncbi:DUF6381 family protein [Streptomyces sp. NPDC058045]|uniref:DUF6381 family protein n=1 Tax=Streptomyces sp. NPDC058045 TaxID=3346311 RepID=UPI0036E40B25